jgi:hypothetical protein
MSAPPDPIQDPAPQPDPNVQRILGGVALLVRIALWSFLVPCLGLIGAGGWIGWQAYVAVTESQSVEGQRISTTAAGTTSSMETPTFYIIYSFTDASGQVRQARSLAATNLLPAPNERVALLWNPERPDIVRRADWLSLWGLPALFFGTGLVFLIPVLWIGRVIRRALSP